MSQVWITGVTFLSAKGQRFLGKAREVFLELVQGLGHPDPLVGGERTGRAIRKATAPTAQTGTIPNTENPGRKALLGKGIDKGIERLGEDPVAEHFPDAVKSLGRAAGFGAKYGTAAVLVKSIVETLLAFLAA